MTDTIYVAVKNTIFSQQQIIDAYRDLVQSQQGTYNTFIILIIALVGVNIVINYFFSKRRLRTEVEEVFSEEENKFRKNFNSYIDKSIKEYTEKADSKFRLLEAETLRLFASTGLQSKNYHHTFDYLLRAVSLYEQLGHQQTSRMCAEQALKSLGFFVTRERNLWGIYFSDIRNRESLIELLEEFPDYLTNEKKEILKLIPKEDNDINNKTKTKPGEISQ